MKTYEEMIAKLAKKLAFTRDTNRGEHWAFDWDKGFCEAISLMFDKDFDEVYEDACNIAREM